MGQKPKILVVDDNPVNLAVCEEMFEAEYDVTLVESGQEALKCIKALQPDIVLLDVMMPGMDGYETCTHIRHGLGMKYVKIIMVSAKAMVRDRLDAYARGADDYVTKPFDVDELLSKVRVYLKLKRTEELSALNKDILALVASEVRTPLQWIKSPAELLRNEPEMTDDRRQRLAQVLLGNAERLMQFFQKAKFLRDIRSGRWSPRVEPTEIHRLVLGLIEETSAAIDRDVSIVDIVHSKPTVSLDADAIRGALSAILDNAVRYSNIGGRVTVELTSTDETVSISVADQGKGIDAALLPRILTEFVDDDTKEYSDGPGLSLALSREIVSAHRGSIDVESEPEVKTVFTVRLPLCPEFADGSEKKATAETMSRS